MLGVVDTYDEAIVRDKPTVFGDPVCILRHMAKVMIDEKESTKDFYKICTPAGVEGYCLKFYLTIEQ